MNEFYTSYQMDIYLPEGVEFTYPSVESENYASIDNSDGVYPTYLLDLGFMTVPFPFQTISSAIQEDGALRVLAADISSNKPFLKHSGCLFKIYVKASSYAKPGDFTISIKGIKFVTPSEDKYLYADQENLVAGTVGNNAKLDLKITAANKIGTGIFPFSCALPDGLEAYTCVGEEGDYLKLQKAQSIAAFTPYILYADGGFSGNLTGTTVSADYPAAGFVSDDYLTGVLKRTEVSSGYILQNKGDGPKFYRVADKPFSLPAGKCFCNPSSSANAPAAFRISFDESAGIGDAASGNTKDGAVYDLQGRKVAAPQSGNIYIINGEKFLKK